MTAGGGYEMLLTIETGTYPSDDEDNAEADIMVNYAVAYFRSRKNIYTYDIQGNATDWNYREVGTAFHDTEEGEELDSDNKERLIREALDMLKARTYYKLLGLADLCEVDL